MNANKNMERVKALFARKEAGIFFILLFLVIVLSITTTGFTNATNLLNIGRQVAVYGIMSVGMGLVMISGNIDLSIGATYGLAGVVTALLITTTGNTAVSLLIGLLLGVAIGAINGFLVLRIKMTSFIATFGMMYVTRGIALLLTNGKPITLRLAGITEEAYGFFYGLGRGAIGGVPLMLIEMVVIFIVAGILLHKTRFGIHLLAIGGNEKTAYVSGIKVQKVRLISFIICGALAAFSGIISMSFIGSILPTAGDKMEFEVFASVIIGGVAMSGGEGRIGGIIIGVFIFGVLKNGLILLGVSAFWQTLIIGLITIIAVAGDSLSKRNKRE